MTTTHSFLEAARQADRSNPEECFGRYVLLSLLGSGGMGTIYRAWDPALHRTVALKILNGTATEDTVRFRREATLAASLQHPNVVPVYETGNFRGQNYLVMALLDGPSLAETEVDTMRAAALVAQAARAVQAAHAQGILHRDLKPANLMLDSEGHLFVTDFGLARRMDDTSLSLPGAVLGTPEYMSPEQARGEIHLDARSDVYSLGATLYALVAGRPPFAGSLPEILRRLDSEDPTPLWGVPRELQAIVHKAMAREVAGRYDTAREFAEDLERFLQGDPVLARPPSVWTKLWRRIRRNPAAWALGLLLLSSIFAGTLVVGKQKTDLDRLETFWNATKLPKQYDETHARLEPILRQAESIGREGRPATDGEYSEIMAKADAELHLLDAPWHGTSLPNAYRGWILVQLGRTEEGERTLREAARMGGLDRGDPYGSVFLARWHLREILAQKTDGTTRSERREALKRDLLVLVDWKGWEEARESDPYRRFVTALLRRLEGDVPASEEALERIQTHPIFALDARLLRQL